ncbi:MAG: AsnC family transcriptional regulator [Thaumarchaeota archaeon S15]|nr:AsnC family transcriptional regulator [Nitrososphaerota archaeon]MDD9843612.1 AsnC family transcriptional regulator [Nitrososphaerota archaeon]RNJ71947.1 MAG: AsnC family transcriptional regulator [Thaumarchaeota archaeon S13]RNJ76926.1 MAG: AsnC family transcriptional regulator [Thaumarchaeota archaeon S15]
MDSTDMGVLSCLLNDCRMADRQVGLRVGLSGGAVRSRVERMERGGLVTRYVLKVEPPALGRGVFFAAVSGRDTEAIIAQVRLVGEPFVVVPCVGGITVCGIAVAGDVQEKIRLARELLRDMRLLTIFEAEAPSRRSRLTRTDLTIMSALMGDPLATAEAVAGSVGISPKTVTRSIEKLRGDRSVQFTAVYNPMACAPYIPHVILAGVSGEPAEAAVRLRESLGSRFMQEPILTPNQIVLFLRSESIYGLDDLTHAVRDTGGVVSADLFIPKRILLPQEWTEAALREAIGSPTLHIARVAGT